MTKEKIIPKYDLNNPGQRRELVELTEKRLEEYPANKEREKIELFLRELEGKIE